MNFLLSFLGGWKSWAIAIVVAALFCTGFYAGSQYQKIKHDIYVAEIENKSSETKAQAAQSARIAIEKNFRENQQKEKEYAEKLNQISTDRDNYRNTVARLRYKNISSPSRMSSTSDPACLPTKLVREAIAKFAEGAGEIARRADQCAGAVKILNVE